ncbi:MAG: GNAT family N-acetyltransferase, partial [Candidatus Zixiibacteriota bacterium]
MLQIRRLVQGVDEPVWVEVLNASRKDREDLRAITVEEMILQEKEDPSFDLEGRFIAELDRSPVGAVHANVEKQREERKGFIRFYVIPESRGRGIERQLVELALRELKDRGMAIAQAFIDSRERGYVELLEGLDFKQVRVVSNMEMELADISQEIGENKQMAIRSLQKEREEEIRLLTWLLNETFKENFNFRPDTVEEVRYFLFSDLYYNEAKETFLAVLDDESVGYIGVGIDEKYNLEKKVQAGDIFTIGVLKQYRRRGIGARLMLHALETLKAKGMTKAMLGVDDYNRTKAMKLYE